MEAAKEMKFGSKVAQGMKEDDARMSSTCIVQRKRAIPHSTMTTVTCVVVTALCNQLAAFALDLGDDQSRYLFE